MAKLSGEINSQSHVTGKAPIAPMLSSTPRWTIVPQPFLSAENILFSRISSKTPATWKQILVCARGLLKCWPTISPHLAKANLSRGGTRTLFTGETQQIVGRERRERVSQVTWCGGGCFDSRRRVNSTVRPFGELFKSMLRFADSDFRPLETFSLSWRWTDERWNNFPEDILRQIKPFTQVKAKELWRIAGHYVLSDGPRVNLFECSPWIDASIDMPNAHEKGRDWLLNKFSGRDHEIIVSWDHSTAVQTTWAVFCDYCDDFCYPSSDDVTVFSPSINWVLFYQHGERFVFGKRLAVGTAEQIVGPERGERVS
jgi:hypothetical protein